MGQEHAPETVWKAQELYCADRLSFDKVAAMVGVAASTLKRWADKYSWREKREELAKAESDIRLNKILARAKTIETLLQNPRADLAFAVSSLETLALKEAEIAMQGVRAEQEASHEIRIETKQDAIKALREAIEHKLNTLLVSPQALELRQVKDVAASLDLLDELEAALPTDPQNEAKLGLDQKMAASLRKALGLKVD